MIVVSDASPLIFLGKINRLELVTGLYKGTIFIPEQVHRELFAQPVPIPEQQELQKFLKNCKVVKVGRPACFTFAMSLADNAALTLAVRNKADVILADDRIVRQMAETEGIRPVGTLGVLLQSCRKKLIDAKTVRSLIEELIHIHRFRISIEVFERVLAELRE